MSPIKNVAIAGASGSVGSVFVDNIIRSKKFNVFVLARETSTATFSSDVKVLKTDYSVESLTSQLSSAKIDAVVSNLSGAALGAPQIALIDAAKAAGVKRFIPSEYGLDTTNTKIVNLIGFFQGKVQTVNHLKTKEGDGFEWTSLITGTFFDWGLQHGSFPVDFETHKLYHWDDGAVPFTVTNLPTIAEAIINLLSDSDKLKATANKYIFISTHTITLNQLFDAVRKATPGEEWTVEHIDSKAVFSKVGPDAAKGDILAQLELLKYLAFAQGIGNLTDYSHVVSDKLLGLERVGLEEDVKKLVQQRNTQ